MPVSSCQDHHKLLNYSPLLNHLTTRQTRSVRQAVPPDRCSRVPARATAPAHKFPKTGRPSVGNWVRVALLLASHNFRKEPSDKISGSGSGKGQTLCWKLGACGTAAGVRGTPT